ncbi:hypothetical protein [Paludisphaera mucosa]|uniref:Uncharacterized protein n=1 Tax=Paludisphaera mucosa TaxID=3030827 RepID=A0ABT6F548_9BACT|nr:hypothetical protein [Paludisphaera mucosa]MDG3002705.1 hypothetical protein [Paludisphaera mucosa]
MTPEDVEPAQEAPATYVPSGRIDLLRLVPLLLVGAVVALVMAFLLLRAESRFYFYLITPLILGAPVFGMVWLVVRGGRCRNRGFAGFVGLLLAFAYYAGYWEISYLVNVVARGPAMVAITEAMGGLPGLPGYVVFRCRTSRPVDVRDRGKNQAARPPGWFDVGFNGLFFGAETLLVVGIAVAVGRSAASRAFSERLRRWADSTDFSLPIATTEQVLAAVDRGDWAAIGALPWTTSKADVNMPTVLLRIEHFASDPDEPAFVSVLLGRGGGKANLILQREIPFDQMDAVAREFPELKRPASGPTPVPAAKGSALQESLERIGLASEPRALLEAPPPAPPTGDFRDPAVAASRASCGNRPAANLDEARTSLCLPASDDGPGELRSAARRIALVQYGLMAGFFASFGVGVAALMIGEASPLGRTLLVIFGVGFCVFGLPGLYFWTGGVRPWRRMVERRLRNRPGSLLDLRPDLPRRILSLQDGKSSKSKLVGDDLGVAFFDRENRRVVFEGLSHRYVILGEDVADFWPLKAGEAVSARVDYRVGDAVLPLVFATSNPLFHLPILAHFSGRLIARFFEDFTQTLRCAPSTEAASSGP